jgi:hypothetical protein
MGAVNPPKLNVRLSMKFLILALILFPFAASASDHIDGPVTKSDPHSDLTDLYAFPTPKAPGSLSVVLNTYPLVGKAGHFVDKVTYNIVLREAAIADSGDKTHFDTSNEVTISCSFQTPAETEKHTVSCTSSNGMAASGNYNTVKEQQPGDDFRVFAGMRSDPFFFNMSFAGALSGEGKLTPPKDSNIMSHANVMSIALDLDLQKVFKGRAPAMVAVAAQSTTRDAPGAAPRNIDRVGRPEITNVSMVSHNEPDLRDQYNIDQPFHVAPENQKKYEARLAKNIAFYDGADGKKDITDAERKHLAGLLADDFLVVDLTKPCKDGDFLEIEKAMVANKEHTSCGGRRPNDDIMDILFTQYVNGSKGVKISDGVDKPFLEPSAEFPYLAEPDLSLLGRSNILMKKIFAALAEAWSKNTQVPPPATSADGAAAPKQEQPVGHTDSAL